MRDFIEALFEFQQRSTFQYKDYSMAFYRGQYKSYYMVFVKIAVLAHTARSTRAILPKQESHLAGWLNSGWLN